MPLKFNPTTGTFDATKVPYNKSGLGTWDFENITTTGNSAAPLFAKNIDLSAVSTQELLKFGDININPTIYWNNDIGGVFQFSAGIASSYFISPSAATTSVPYYSSFGAGYNLLTTSTNFTYNGNKLTLGGATSSTNGLRLGADVDLWRHASGVLRSNTTYISGQLAVNEDPASNPYQQFRVSKYPGNDNAHLGAQILVWNSSAYSRTQYNAGVVCDHYYLTTSDCSAGLFGGIFNMAVLNNKNTGTLSNAAGGRFSFSWQAVSTATGDDLKAGEFSFQTSSASSANITTAHGAFIKFEPNTSAPLTITNARGATFRANGTTGGITNFAHAYFENPSAGTITNNYGAYFEDLSRGTNNFAIYFAGTSGLARQGIHWNGDTNLYRSAADTLKTDDRFRAETGVSVPGTSGATYIATSNTTAPTRSTGGTPTNYYGGGPKNYLGDPVDWMLVNVNGVDRKIPLY